MLISYFLSDAFELDVARVGAAVTVPTIFKKDKGFQLLALQFNDS